jgi:V8-like Glu-specific endopeptidase
MGRILVVALMLISLATNTADAVDWTALVDSIKTSVVRLEKWSPDGDDSCSGTLINKEAGFVLTAAHCVLTKSGQEISALTINGRDARVVRYNSILDLAITRMSVKDESQINVAKSMPKAGDQIAILGYGLGSEVLVVQFGYVAATFEPKTKKMWVNADLLYGDSGGTVVNYKGELVGVPSRIFGTGMAHIGGVVTLDRVIDFTSAYRPRP